MNQSSKSCPLESFVRDLRQITSFLHSRRTLDADINDIAAFFQRHMPLTRLMLIRLEPSRASAESAYWGFDDALKSKCRAYLEAHLGELIATHGAGGSLDANPLVGLAMENACKEDSPLAVAIRPVLWENSLRGFALFGKDASDGLWSAGEMGALDAAAAVAGVSFEGKAGIEGSILQSFVFNGFMDNMRAHLYVTDPHTDKILFMNASMKKAYGIPQPEGMVCWKALRRSKDHRCAFCPVDQLIASEAESPSIIWEEHCDDQEKVYENYDSLMPWMDGSIVHFQHSIDITESKLLTREATTDELTDMLNRRAGKCALSKSLQEAREKRIPISVCMYDVNSLKKVNDAFGHVEGDFLISTIASTLKSFLRAEDYPFRLSGDEFIVVFPGLREAEAERIMKKTLAALSEKRAIFNKPYSIGFCFGMLECDPDEELSVSDILRQTDARMYESKRQYHILDAVHTMTDNPLASVALGANFSYDRERLYDALVRSMDDYIFVCNMKTKIFRYSPNMVEEFPIPGEFIENAVSVWEKIVHPDDKGAFLSSFDDILQGVTRSHCVEYRAMNRKGDWVWLRSRGHLAFEDGGDPSLFAGIITNLGKKNKVDHLTGLLNKHEFELSVNSLLTNRANAPLGIMLLNLDEFRHINDTFNREFGDEILRITAHKLQSHLPQSASIYRMDGDEFAVLFREGRRKELLEYFERIRGFFEEQQEYNGHKYFCTISAGAALYPMDAINHLDLYKYAGYSLEYAKSRGKGNCFLFTQEIMRNKTREIDLIEQLRASMEHDYKGYSLNYQPQVEAATGQVCGAEALLRWTSETYGPILPLEFIPLLDKSGMIQPVGRWVIRNAIRTCKKWVEAKPDFSICINISYHQLVHPDFTGFLRREIEEAGLKPRNVTIEMTEVLMSTSYAALSEVFAELHTMGVRIAIDDFGTGTSSLEILKVCPADIVKIDRAFVRDIRTNAFDATFVKFIVALCHEVNIRVCLEGVESLDEYAAVQPMALDTIQGFLFGRPLAEEEFIQLMNFDGEAQELV